MNPDDYIHKLRALEEMFRSHYKILRAYACRYVNDMETSEDIVQDVFCELLSRMDAVSFGDATAIKAYLFKAIYNRCLNTLQKRRREIYSLDEAVESRIAEQYMETHQQDPGQSLMLKELESEIAVFVQTLPPQCRKIFTLSRSHELKNGEIAEQLGISVKAVERQITKALQGMKEYLRRKELI
jgi:RNA polymerase sigma-70 factor (ECF subfamily)